MDKIVKLLVFLVVVYLAYSVGLPWIKGLLGSSSGTLRGDAGEEALCVGAAERAVDAFGERLSRFSPPIDADAWEAAVSRSRDEIAEAERGCGCAYEACREASRALSSLEDMVTDYDGSVRDGRGIPANGARRLEGLYDTLERARTLAR
jgi:hypothetical protein